MHRFANNRKTVLLLGALIALFVLVGSLWGREGMIVGLALGGLMNVIAWFFSDTIAIKSMRGREVTREASP